MESDALLTDLLLEENTFLKLDLFSVKKGPSIMVKQRELFGEFNTLYGSLRSDPEAFYEYTRMSVSTFDYILKKVDARLRVPCTNFHTTISPEEKLIVTLRYLATGISFRALAVSFRMGKTTIASIVYETCAAIWSELVKTHMAPPSQDEMKKIAEDYNTLWQFPHCIGAVDSIHFEIICPDQFSVVLQAVADASKKFIAIEVGTGVGRESDDVTLHHSVLNKLMESGNLNIPPPDLMPQTQSPLPYVFIAGEAYPLKPNLMRPFPERTLNDKRNNYNQHLSDALKCVQCAFGILCAKWNLLLKPLETNVQHACLIIKTACLLHNIIGDCDGNSDPHYNMIKNSTVTLKHTHLSRRNNSSSIVARNVRDLFVTYFWQNRESE